jgi:hypothetical protein
MAARQEEVGMRRIVALGLTILLYGSVCFAGTKTFTGVVSDSRCGIKHITNGTPEGVEKCVAAGASYVLVANDGNVYLLDSQDKFKGLGGKTVIVKGNLNTVTINVKSVETSTKTP